MKFKIGTEELESDDFTAASIERTPTSFILKFEAPGFNSPQTRRIPSAHASALEQFFNQHLSRFGIVDINALPDPAAQFTPAPPPPPVRAQAAPQTVQQAAGTATIEELVEYAQSLIDGKIDEVKKNHELNFSDNFVNLTAPLAQNSLRDTNKADLLYRELREAIAVEEPRNALLKRDETRMANRAVPHSPLLNAHLTADGNQFEYFRMVAIIKFAKEADAAAHAKHDSIFNDAVNEMLPSMRQIHIQPNDEWERKFRGRGGQPDDIDGLERAWNAILPEIKQDWARLWSMEGKDRTAMLDELRSLRALIENNILQDAARDINTIIGGKKKYSTRDLSIKFGEAIKYTYSYDLQKNLESNNLDPAQRAVGTFLFWKRTQLNLLSAEHLVSAYQVLHSEAQKKSQEKDMSKSYQNYLLCVDEHSVLDLNTPENKQILEAYESWKAGRPINAEKLFVPTANEMALFRSKRLTKPEAAFGAASRFATFEGLQNGYYDKIPGNDFKFKYNPNAEAQRTGNRFGTISLKEIGEHAKAHESGVLSADWLKKYFPIFPQRLLPISIVPSPSNIMTRIRWNTMLGGLKEDKPVDKKKGGFVKGCLGLIGWGLAIATVVSLGVVTVKNKYKKHFDAPKEDTPVMFVPNHQNHQNVPPENGRKDDAKAKDDAPVMYVPFNSPQNAPLLEEPSKPQSPLPPIDFGKIDEVGTAQQKVNKAIRDLQNASPSDPNINDLKIELFKAIKDAGGSKKLPVETQEAIKELRSNGKYSKTKAQAPEPLVASVEVTHTKQWSLLQKPGKITPDGVLNDKINNPNQKVL